MNLKAYYQITKPGIIYGNLITAIAGYLMASELKLRWVSLLSLAVGLSLIIGSACVFNNLYDRDIDFKMERTKNRPSVTGIISLKAGIIYATVMAIIGFSVLIAWDNVLTAMIAALGFIVYVLAYSYSKRKTHYSTLIGSISGATPIVGGYVAYSNQLTLAALVIGLMMLLWQMPHFYAISIYRESDYRKANVPVLSVVAGKKITSYWMVFYSFVFLIASIFLYFTTRLSIAYLIVMVLVALAWLVINIRGLFIKTYDSWAKKSFFSSLGVMLMMSLMIALR